MNRKDMRQEPVLLALISITLISKEHSSRIAVAAYLPLFDI